MKKVLKWLGVSAVLLGIGTGKIIGGSNIPSIYKVSIEVIIFSALLIFVYKNREEMNRKKYISLIILIISLLILIIGFEVFLALKNVNLVHGSTINLCFKIGLLILTITVIVCAIIAARSKDEHRYFKKWNDK